jgi:hypothetical protein
MVENSQELGQCVTENASIWIKYYLPFVGLEGWRQEIDRQRPLLSESFQGMPTSIYSRGTH